MNAVGSIPLSVFFVGGHESPTSPNSSTTPDFMRLRLDPKWVLLKSSSKVVMASSSSISGSGAGDFSSEQLLVPKRRKQRIAGIDQDELLDPAHLADPDSCFCEFKGLKIHHKICEAESPEQNFVEHQISSQSPNPTKKIGLPMILLHGFGASLFSWHRVMKPLAQVAGSKVVAFDRPAFGLTTRVNPMEHSSASNPYSPMFSVLATLHFIDFLRAQKAVLIGHSAGSLVAVQTYFEAPDRVAALILVSPAILAPLTANNVAKGTQSGKENEFQEDESSKNINGNVFVRLCNILSQFSKFIVQGIMQLVKGFVNMLNSLYKKALSAFLRSSVAVMLVRFIIDKFGIAAIRNSWYDSTQVTDHVLHGYTKPLRTKGWDRALLDFTAAILTGSVSESKPPLTKRLHEISCPVLIITGDSDRIVPSWNAEKLSRAIPGACLKVIKNCGHLPHEEKAEEFMSIVEEFMHGVLGSSEMQLLPAAI